MQTPTIEMENTLREKDAQLVALHKHVASLEAQLSNATNQLNWFKRQLFGRKSEKLIESNPDQLDLFKNLLKQSQASAASKSKTVTIPQHERRKNVEKDAPDDSGLRFDSSVPTQEIQIPCPALEAEPDRYQVIGEKTTYRLAQRPSSYVVLVYKRPVIKEKKSSQIITPQAPSNVIEKSFADVSLLAGILVDKFDYHLPLYRQHRRMLQSGITLSRSTLTNLVFKAILLLKPIHQAILASILKGRNVAIDETPIRFGRKKKGKMNTGYYWPIIRVRVFLWA